MSEIQEKVWIVNKRRFGTSVLKPLKAFDDRSDARAFAKRLNQMSKMYDYTVAGVKKG